jgi:hypothetical protein
VGSAAALGAALANGRIYAFMLTAPEGQVAEAEGYGQIFIEPDRDSMSLFQAIKVPRTDRAERVLRDSG